MTHPHEGVLAYFWSLADLDESRRVTAAKDLIEHLTKLQQAIGYAEPHPDVRYTLERLIKGLASPRAGARQGFALALTSLLEQFPLIPTEQVIESLLQNTHPTGSATGQEERDAYFGRAFGLMALIRAGRISKKDGSIAAIVRESVALWQKKSFLAELCSEILNSLFAKISEEELRKVLPLLKETLVVAPEEYSAEQLAVLLQLEGLFKFNVGEQFPDKGWQQGSLLDSNLSLVVNALCDSSYTTPKLHSVWEYVLARIASQEASPEHSNFVGRLWRQVVEEGLFNLTAGYSRKYLGFQLFEKMLPLLDAKTIPMVFTDNFMRSFVTNLADPSTKLHAVAKHALDRLMVVAEKDPHAKIALLSQLLGKHGHRRNFDQLTGTKTVERLTQGWNAAHVHSYLTQLEESFYGSPTDEKPEKGGDEESDEERVIKEVEDRRLWVLDQIHALMRNPKLPKDPAMISEALSFVAAQAFVTVEKEPARGSNSTPSKSKKAKTTDASKVLRLAHPALTTRTREQAHSRLLSLLHELLTQHADKEKIGGLDADGSPWALSVYRLLREVTKSSTASLNAELTEEAEAARKRLEEALVWLHRFLDAPETSAEKDRAAYHRARAFQLLLAHLGVLLYGGDEDVPSLIEDVVECRARLLEVASGDAEDPVPIVVFVDSLVSLMSRPSVLFRDLVGQVFRVFATDVNTKALDLLLKIVQSEPGREGPAGGEHGESDAEDEDDEEEDFSEGSDEEEKDAQSDPKRKAKFEAALAAKKAGKKKRKELEDEVEGGDLGDESEDDTLPPATDEEMLMADAKLAEMFKHMKAEKTAGADRDREALNFKLRVLDLVETFLRRQPQSPIVLRAVQSLCTTAARYHQAKEKRPLFDRVSALLVNRIGHQKEYAKDVPCDESLRVLRSLLSRLRRTTATGLLLPPLLAAVHFVIKMFLQAADDETHGVLLEDLRKMLALVLRKRRALRLDFFADLIRKFSQLASLCKDLLAGAMEGRNLFLRCEAFTLSTKALAQRGVPLAEAVALLDDVKDAVLRFSQDAEVAKNGKKLNAVLQSLLHLLQYVSKASRDAGEALPWTNSWTTASVLPALRKFASESNSAAVPGVCGALATLLFSSAEIGQELKQSGKKQEKKTKEEEKGNKDVKKLKQTPKDEPRKRKNEQQGKSADGEHKSKKEKPSDKSEKSKEKANGEDGAQKRSVNAVKVPAAAKKAKTETAPSGEKKKSKEEKKSSKE